MESLILDRDKNTPYVNFDYLTGILEIKGSSIPEDSHKFFHPLMQWIEKYLTFFPPSITISLQFEYLNTSSSKWVLKLLDVLAHYNETTSCVTFNWYWDENDLLDTGHYYQTLLGIEFNFIEYR